MRRHQIITALHSVTQASLQTLPSVTRNFKHDITKVALNHLSQDIAQIIAASHRVTQASL